MHDGYENTYSFTKDGRRIVLAPLPPQQVQTNQVANERKPEEGVIVPPQLVSPVKEIANEEFPKVLSPMKGVEYEDLIPCPAKSDRSAYQRISDEDKELQHRANEVIDNYLIVNIKQDELNEVNVRFKRHELTFNIKVNVLKIKFIEGHYGSSPYIASIYLSYDKLMLDWIWFRKKKKFRRKNWLMLQGESPAYGKKKINDYKVEPPDASIDSTIFRVRAICLHLEGKGNLDLRTNPFEPGGDDVPQNAVQGKSISSLGYGTCLMADDVPTNETQIEVISNLGPLTRSKGAKLTTTYPGVITILECLGEEAKTASSIDKLDL